MYVNEAFIAKSGKKGFHEKVDAEKEWINGVENRMFTAEVNTSNDLSYFFDL